jgi:hypothetical protein
MAACRGGAPKRPPSSRRTLLSLMRSHMSMTSLVVYACGPASVSVRPLHSSLRSAAIVMRATS